MAENSNIEWTDHTFNPWSGCTKVSPACDHCYAEVNYSVKMRGVKWGKYGNRIIAADSMWKQPLLWNRKAEQGICLKCNGKGIVPSKEFDWQPCERCDQNGRVEPYRARVFCASLADVFEGNDTMPDAAFSTVNLARLRLFELIERTPHLDWLLLTKRPELVMELTPVRWREKCTPRREPVDRFPPNVWIGTTVENQKYADIRIPELLKIPAKVRFLSVVPMLGPIDLRHVQHDGTVEIDALTGDHGVFRPLAGRSDKKIHWVITGGESGGAKARPMEIEWVVSLKNQCEAAGVPFFFKQGAKANWPDFKNFASFPADLQIREVPDAGKSK